LAIGTYGQAATVIIVGNNPRGYALCRRLESSISAPVNVIGFVNSWPEGAPEDNGHPILGSLDRLDTILTRHQVDGVFFAVPRRMIDQLEPAVRLCETIGVRYWLAADLFGHATGRIGFDRVTGWPMISYEPTRHRRGVLLVKRGIDVLLSAAALALLCPVLLLISVLVRATSKGGALFTQVRCGLNGRPFRMLKFRTMVQDAEGQRASLQDRNEMRGPVFKMDSDPRITAVGSMLRRYYLDELPQLVNVLVGHMSVVGPRPPLPSEVAEYDLWQRRRLCVRPGLTCIWQVSKGVDADRSFARWAALDLEYIDRWSLWLDLKLMLRTLPAVLRATGR